MKSKKILIAIKNEFIKNTYLEVLTKAGFLVKELEGLDLEKDVLDKMEKEKIDLLLLDAELGGLDILNSLRSSEIGKNNLPKIVIFSQIYKEEYKNQAIELEAKDYVAATNITPAELVRRVKILLGEQRSYLISINKTSYDAKDLIVDLGYDYNFKCPVCGSDMVLYLIRDLSKGEKNFIVSAICPVCKK